MQPRVRGVRRDLNVPLYEQVKGLLRLDVQEGRLSRGDLVPSEPAMCADYGVSRTVVRQAVGDLVGEGVLVRVRGKGTYVEERQPKPPPALETVDYFDRSLALARHNWRVLKCDLEEASVTTAAKLGISVGQTYLHLTRVCQSRGASLALTQSHINSSDPRLVSELKRTSFTRNSLYTVLRDRWNVTIASGSRRVAAVPARSPVTHELQIRSGAPVLSVESLVRDPTGAVIEHAQGWYVDLAIEVQLLPPKELPGVVHS